MEAGGGIIDDEALVVAEELEPNVPAMYVFMEGGRWWVGTDAACWASTWLLPWL